MKEKFSDIKEGQWVIMSHPFYSDRLEMVERIGKTFIVINDQKYSHSGLIKPYQSGNYRILRVANSDDIALHNGINRRNDIVNFFKEYDLSKVSNAIITKLEEIIELIEDEEDE